MTESGTEKELSSEDQKKGGTFARLQTSGKSEKSPEKPTAEALGFPPPKQRGRGWGKAGEKASWTAKKMNETVPRRNGNRGPHRPFGVNTYGMAGTSTSSNRMAPSKAQLAGEAEAWGKPIQTRTFTS